MKRDNIESYRLPFTFDVALDELRMLIWCTASQVALLGRNDLATEMIEPDAEFGMNENPKDHLTKINLDAYVATQMVKDAFDFAFQVNDPARFSADDWGDLTALVGGVHHSWSGELSPPWREDSKLRHVADMVLGRVELLTGGALSIRQLALLANMIEPAVRSSLSTEGIKTEGRPASLPAVKALAWLRGRRGFVPTADGQAVQQLVTESTAFEARPFPKALQHLIAAGPKSNQKVATITGLDLPLVQRLAEGNERNAGVQDLVKLAAALQVEPSPLVEAYLRFVSGSS
jgi:hypothetical protein